MTIYITQGNYTTKGAVGVLDKPEDRAQAVAALMEASGGRLLNYYVTLGDYDFVVITEAENERDVIAALVTTAASGTVTNLRTVPAITSAEAAGVFERAQSIRAGFRPAGG